MKFQSRIFCKELLHPRPLMPGSIIQEKIDDPSLEAIHNPCQHLEESISISSYPLHDSMPSVERVDPPENVQALLMLAFCIDIGFCPFLTPHSPELWMKGKPCLILKKYHPLIFTPLGEKEFFLTFREIPLPLPQSPGRSDKLAVSENSPTSSSTAGHDEPGSLCNGLSSGILSPRSHPTDFLKSHNPEETWIAPRRDPS